MLFLELLGRALPASAGSEALQTQYTPQRICPEVPEFDLLEKRQHVVIEIAGRVMSINPYAAMYRYLVLPLCARERLGLTGKVCGFFSLSSDELESIVVAHPDARQAADRVESFVDMLRARGKLMTREGEERFSEEVLVRLDARRLSFVNYAATSPLLR